MSPSSLRVEQELHADAHAEEVRAAAHGAQDRVVEAAARAAPPSPTRPAPTPGMTTKAAARDVLGPVGDRDLRAGALERSAQRAQVAGAVVDERGDHRTPLVLAMPLRAGSGSTASRSASASALNAASAHVVGVLAARADVQAEPAAAREAVEEVRDQRRRHLPDRRGRERRGRARRCRGPRGRRWPRRAPRRAARARSRSGARPRGRRARCRTPRRARCAQSSTVWCSSTQRSP